MKKLKYYVLVEIGCIECNLDSNVLGIFTNKEKAQALKDKYEDVIDDICLVSDYQYEVFEINLLDNLIFPCKEVQEYLTEYSLFGMEEK